MRSLFSAVVALVVGACHAPAVGVDPPDTAPDVATEAATDVATDTATDTKTCPVKKKPDGTECTGHDEDGDCVPDECDDCPALANDDPALGWTVVGAACAHHEAPFDVATERLVFNPFNRKPTWPQVINWPTDEFKLDGTTNDDWLGGNEERRSPFVYYGPWRPGVTIVATTIFTMIDTITQVAVLLDVQNPAPSQFYACVVDALGFYPAHVTGDNHCNGLPCAFKTFDDAGGKRVIAPLPAALKLVPGVRLGLRASMTPGDLGTDRVIECRVFDPANPATMQVTSGTGYSLRANAGPIVFAGAPVGLLASGPIRFESIDVLQSPLPK